MKIRVLSDLHLDFDDDQAPFTVPELPCDVVVIAGDVQLGSAGIDWIADRFGDVPKLYVLGNREFYRHAIPELTHGMRERAVSVGVTILENQSITIGDVRFLGCTLWTDFELFGKTTKSKSMDLAQSTMNDFKLIEHRGFNGDDGHGYKFCPMDSTEIHQESIAWLRAQFDKAMEPNTKTVVITHHAPSRLAIQEQYANHLLSPAFASNLDSLVTESGADLWIYGHIHSHRDYRIGKTRLIANPRGYPHENSGFDESLIVVI